MTSVNSNFDFDFDYDFYVNYYEDMRSMSSRDDAYEHYQVYGKHEGRFCNIKDVMPLFDWQNYVNMHSDLNVIKSRKDAMIHYLNFGRYEGRACRNIYKYICMYNSMCINDSISSIAFILTEPMNVDTLIDIMINIRFFVSKNFNVIFLIHIKKHLLNCFSEQLCLLKNTYLFEIANDNRHGYHDLTHFQMKSVNFLKDNNIKCEYISLNATNELFFRELNANNIARYVIDIEKCSRYNDNKIKSNFDNICNARVYIENHFSKHMKDDLLKATHTIDFFNKKKIVPHCAWFEGTIYTQKTLEFVSELWYESKIYEHEPHIRCFMEEIFLPSVLNSFFSINQHARYTYKEYDFGCLLENNKNSKCRINQCDDIFLTYKRVDRCENFVRTTIRNLYLDSQGNLKKSSVS